MDHRELLRTLALTVGTYITEKKTSFTPGELAKSMGERLGKPKEEIMDRVLDLCKELIELGFFWVDLSNHTYTKVDSVITVKHGRPFRTDPDM